MSLKDKARETLALIDRGEYELPDGQQVSIAAAQSAAVAGTRLYSPEQLRALVSAAPSTAAPRVTVELLDATTQAAALELCIERRRADCLLLNFASARNPGGGFLNGARAQEEDLCRCSGLYPTLLTQPRYYEANRAQRSALYTDHMIYSPGVPFFRVSGRGALLQAPFTAAVITAPAPNAGAMRQKGAPMAPLEETFARRWKMVLAIARDQGHGTVLLGAWGCGAFGNDPEIAARTALAATDAFAPELDHVAFAIPNQGARGRANYQAFARQIAASPYALPQTTTSS